MGVRGTKFQTSYSPRTNRTTLVTVEGEVRMAKVEKFDPRPIDVKKTDVILEAKQKAVVVTPGKFAVTESKISKPTQPTNIAPKQFDIIAKELESKSTAKLVMNDSQDDKDADEHINLRKDLIKYKAGGYVDFETGEYIAPEKTAKLDKKTNTYEAPKKALIAQDGKVEKIKANKKDDGPSFWSKYLPEAYRLGVFFMPYSEKQSVDNKENGEESSFYSESADFGGINVDLKWNDKIRTILNLGGGDFKLNKEDLPIEEYGDGSFYLDLRLEYTLDQMWKLIGALSVRSYRFAFENLDPSNPRITSEDRDLAFYSFGASRKLESFKSNNLVWSALLNIYEKKNIYLGSTTPNSGDESVRSLGLFTDIEASYTFFSSYYLRPSLWFEYTKHDADSKDYSRSRLGAKVLVQKEF